MRVHGHHVLKHPEEGPRVAGPGLEQVEDAVVLKEQPATALCWREEGYTTRGLTARLTGRLTGRLDSLLDSLLD